MNRREVIKALGSIGLVPVTSKILVGAEDRHEVALLDVPTRIMTIPEFATRMIGSMFEVTIRGIKPKPYRIEPGGDMVNIYPDRTGFVFHGFATHFCYRDETPKCKTVDDIGNQAFIRGLKGFSVDLTFVGHGKPELLA